MIDYNVALTNDRTVYVPNTATVVNEGSAFRFMGETDKVIAYFPREAVLAITQVT